MRKSLYFVLPLVFILSAQTLSQTINDTNADEIRIVITKLNITDKNLELQYLIINDSQQDIWICENSGSMGFEVDMVENDETLLIRRRLNVPMEGYGNQPSGSYIRVLAGESRSECMFMPIPIHPQRILLAGRRSETNNVTYLKRLILELEYYEGNLPERIFSILDKSENEQPLQEHIDERGVPLDTIGWLRTSVDFNRSNENVSNRRERVLIPWMKQALKGAIVLQTAVDNLKIPYEEVSAPIRLTEPELTNCSSIEIYFEPSVFEYFFPYEHQQSLFNSKEIELLKSNNTVLLKDPEFISAFTGEVPNSYYGSIMVTKNSKIAKASLFNGDNLLVSFIVYDERYIETEEKKYYWYRGGLESLETLVSNINMLKPYELRIQCAANLQKLWYRLRLYHKAMQIGFDGLGAPLPIEYPIPNEWCDAMVEAYDIGGVGTEVSNALLHKCPAMSNDKSHYAMNPNCTPDSPDHMVLLFETKAGWNQNGGTELFTFDNHSPRGGCVLLNDGTVKFIRTEEELNALKWSE